MIGAVIWVAVATIVLAGVARADDSEETMDNVVCREVVGSGGGGFYTCPLIGTMGVLQCPTDDEQPCYYAPRSTCVPPKELVCRPAWVWEQAKDVR